MAKVNVMVDLETMGLRPDAAIVSIGAVVFDKMGVTDQTFFSAASLSSCLAIGLTTDPETVDWWSKQSVEAQSRWRTADAPSIEQAMIGFTKYLQFLGKASDICLWGNGSDFDCVLLTSAYRALEADPPWKFYNVRCFRTLKNLCKLQEMKRLGVHHDALDDAKHQASHAVRILQNFPQLEIE